jgi:Xaa-Pro aminopeptidase
VPNVLLIGDTLRSPELRHEVPLGIGDPFFYLEVDGHRHVYIAAMEAQRLGARDLGLIVHPFEEIGRDELVARGLSLQELLLEAAARACAHAGLTSAVVPVTFPAGYLDRQRREGVELVVDQAEFDDRRRVKTAEELAGIRRAQRAAEAGLAAGMEVLRGAVPRNGALVHEGEELTVERVKAAVASAFLEHGAVADEFIVAPGPQGAVGHEMGHGPIRPGEPVVFDLWPRDPASSCYADMTRTVVVGSPSDEVREWHRLAREALAQTTALVRAGVDSRSLHLAACDVFEQAGYPTQRTKAAGEVLVDGFFHGLGHGVGLDVHEQPSLGITQGRPLVAGDVITLEPGLYRRGVGGVRLEDLVLVTEDGCEVLTDAPYGLDVP